MSGAQKTAFQQRFASTNFTDADMARSLGTDGEIVSVRGRKGSPYLFAVKLSTQNGEFGPFILNRTAAENLKASLAREGF